MADQIRHLVVVSLVGLLAACGDFHGPWEYYPHTTEIYAGVYTYGYIIEGESRESVFPRCMNWKNPRQKTSRSMTAPR